MWKSMWTDRWPSWLLLVRVRKEGGVAFTIPLSLAVLDVGLEAISDLAWLGETLFPGWRNHLGRHRSKAGEFSLPAGFSPAAALRLGRSLFREMRRYGRWRMVEVSAEGYHVSVDFF